MPFLKIRAMSCRFLPVVALLFSLSAAGAEPGGTDTGRESINPGVPWPATDALGRELPLTLDEIDNLVERLRDEVVDSGFDADYALNERGRILDGLADRLFSRFLMSRPDQG